MFSNKYAIYLGTESETIFTGFIVDKNLYLVLKVDDGLSKESGREILKEISTSIKAQNIQSLDDFEYFLSSKWKEHNLPAEFSFAAGYIYENTLYLKTSLYGQIYIKKDENFAKIIDGENKASGKIDESDFLVFANREFTKLVGGEEGLARTFDHRSPHQILENITPSLKSQNDEGAIALFVTFEEEGQAIATDRSSENEEIQLTLPKTSLIRDKLSELKEIFYSRFKNNFSKKPITLILVTILAVFLIWSLFLGYSRKNLKEESLIKEKLSQAEEVADINLPRAIALLGDAKKDLDKIKKESNNKPRFSRGKEANQIIKLDRLIKEYEGRILKSEEKNFIEFYDLSVENKSANIKDIYKFEDSIAALDSSGILYIISLSKKSIDSRKSSAIKNSKLVALYENIAYFLKNDGIYSIAEDDKAKKIIDEDNWGSVDSISAYAGNIYLLDTKKSDIYKYIPIEDGFSSKKSYFGSGQGVNLGSALSMSIDGSVFIGFPENIIKYTSGLRDGFSTSYPKEDLNLSKIFTDKDTDNIYAWSKTDGTIYVLSKNGGYESQIKSSILKKATDFVVYNGAIYTAQGPKIYKISLE